MNIFKFFIPILLTVFLASCQSNISTNENIETGSDESEAGTSQQEAAVSGNDLFYCWRSPVADACPKIVAFKYDDMPIEPSGVTVAKSGQAEIFLGVTDNVNELIKISQTRFGDDRLKAYAIFAFHPTAIEGRDSKGNIVAYPILLDAQQRATFPLFDLEGIAYNASAEDMAFYAISSLSRYKRAGTDREYLDRKQAYRLQLKASNPALPLSFQNAKAVNMSIVKPPASKDVESWVLSTTNWNMFSTSPYGRAETEGGLNVEGIAIAGNTNFEASGSTKPGFVIGMRGPILGHNNIGDQHPAPGAYSTTYRMITTDNNYTSYGIRGMDSLARFRDDFRQYNLKADPADWFVVALGTTGEKNPVTGKYGQALICLVYMPDMLSEWKLSYNGAESCQLMPHSEFVAEGVAITSVTVTQSAGPPIDPYEAFDISAEVILVDDNAARVAQISLHCPGVAGGTTSVKCSK